MFNPEFQFYPARVESKKPLGSLSLFEMLRANMNPNDNIKDVFRRIAEAEVKGDTKLKAQLKQENLYYFTPCVVSNGLGRGYADIVGFTGLLVLDFDHIDNATEFKYYIFNKYNFIVAGWLSPSKRGCKFLVKIPVVKTTDEFKSYFFGVAIEMEKYKGFDGTGQNCVLPLFLSIDGDLLFRDDAVQFLKKGKKIDEFIPSNYAPIVLQTGEGEKGQVKRLIMSAVNLIIDNGHPQLRSAGVRLGGYVATGYIDINEAENFIYDLIRNNSYLRKGVDGYCKTAKTAIQTGMKSQLFLNTNK
jgi:VirE N-terminal domain.